MKTPPCVSMDGVFRLNEDKRQAGIVVAERRKPSGRVRISAAFAGRLAPHRYLSSCRDATAKSLLK